MPNLIPYVIEKTPYGERSTDIFSRLLKERIVMLSGEVDFQSAEIVKASLLYLESEDATKPIDLYINSPGGSVTDGFSIYDTMQYIKCPVRTICTGMAASMGAFLLIGGEKGMRYAMPNSEVMIHQPLISGGLRGQQTDISIHARNLEKTRDKLEHIMASRSGNTFEDMHKWCERDNYLSAEEALKMGLIDEIITKR